MRIEKEKCQNIWQNRAGGVTRDAPDHPGWEEGSVHAGLVIEMVTSRNGRVVKRISTIQQYYYIVRLSVSITTIRSLIAPTEHSFIMNIIIF